MKDRIVHQYTKLDADYIDLRMLFQSLLEKKRFIVIVTLSIFSLVMIYAMIKPIKYQSSILLKIQHKQTNALETLSSPNQQISLGNLSEEPLAVQMALIQSEFVLRPVIQSLGLDIKVTPYQYSLINYLFNKNPGSISIATLTVPANYLNKSLTISITANQQYRLYDQNNEVLLTGRTGQHVSGRNDFSVKVDQINAPVGSQFTIKKDQEFDVINKIHKELAITDLSGSADSANNKVAILRVSLTGSDPVLITRILNQLALVTQQQNIKLKAQEAENALRFLNQQLPVIKSSLKQAEEKLNDYRSTNGKVDIKLQSEYLLTHLSDINKQLEKLHLKKVNLLQQYTLNHPSVIAIDEEVSELEKHRNELTSQLKKLPASEQEALNLKREVDVKNNVYMILLNQIHQLEVIKTGIMSDVQILSYASTPYMLQPMKLSVIGMFGLFIGLIVGCLIVLIWRIFMRRISDPNWTEHTWNIKNLAIIPFSHEQSALSHSLQKQTCLPLLAQASPNDIAIESLCSVRTFLQLALENAPNNIIAMMGIAHGVGKTFISANLACLLARIGNKVLIIDADIRRGHMNQYFKTKLAIGLTDVINGKANVDDVIVQPADYPDLAYLPAGTQTERVADLLMCDTFKSLLLSLSKNYQYVFINTPPNMFNTDNFLIGSLAGVNLLVLGAHVHEGSDIDRVIKNFNHAGIQLNGCIFNNLKPGKNKFAQSGGKLISAGSNVTRLRYHTVAKYD